MNNPTTFYIIRHGESEGNIKKLYGVTPEVALTDTGRQQVEKRSKEFAAVHFDAIFASDLLRAQQTAEILRAERKLVIQTKEALRERHYGRLDGKTKSEMRAELQELFDAYENMSAKKRYYHKLVPDMESVEDGVVRLLRALREIAVAYEGKQVLIVSHVSLMRGLLIKLGFVDFHEITSEKIENTAWIKLESNGIDFEIKATDGIHNERTA